MIARLDEIGKDLKEVKRENASLLKALLEANSNAEKVVPVSYTHLTLPTNSRV